MRKKCNIYQWFNSLICLWSQVELSLHQRREFILRLLYLFKESSTHTCTQAQKIIHTFWRLIMPVLFDLSLMFCVHAERLTSVVCFNLFVCVCVLTDQRSLSQETTNGSESFRLDFQCMFVHMRVCVCVCVYVCVCGLISPCWIVCASLGTMEVCMWVFLQTWATFPKYR